mgnify:CR=1 FL=1
MSRLCRPLRCRKALSTCQSATATAAATGCRPLRCRKALSTGRNLRDHHDGHPCRPLRCRKALSTAWDCPSRPSRRVPTTSMPKGVEHSLRTFTPPMRALCRPLRCRKALSTRRSTRLSSWTLVPTTSMPKGVEHLPTGTTPTLSAKCRPLRCRKALSTLPWRVSWSVVMRVPTTSMPKGVEHWTVIGIVGVFFGCRPLRCRKALSTPAWHQLHWRCTPLQKGASALLAAWSKECESSPDGPVFPNARGGHLSRDGVAYIVARHTAAAIRRCPSLENKRVSPHVLRHTAAMNLLQHGVDRCVIALWLGHESVETTDVYLHASLEMKERALARTGPQGISPGRYKPSNDVLAFLRSL